MNRKPFKNYNATIITFDADGKKASACLAHVVDGRIYRTNGHWSHLNGTEEYQAIWEKGRCSFEKTYKIYLDNGKAYKDFLRS